MPFGPAGLAEWLEDAVGIDFLKVHCTKSNPHASFSDDENTSVIKVIRMIHRRLMGMPLVLQTRIYVQKELRCLTLCNL